jgi:hypothetical protein
VKLLTPEDRRRLEREARVVIQLQVMTAAACGWLAGFVTAFALVLLLW